MTEFRRVLFRSPYDMAPDADQARGLNLSAMVAALGTVGGYAVAGVAFLLPPLIWAVVIHLSRPRKQPPPVNNELTRVLLAAVAKETPWLAIVGAGLAAAANMFLNRNKAPK